MFLDKAHTTRTFADGYDVVDSYLVIGVNGITGPFASLTAGVTQGPIRFLKAILKYICATLYYHLDNFLIWGKNAIICTTSHLLHERTAQP